jgi:hypothetical protein
MDSTGQLTLDLFDHFHLVAMYWFLWKQSFVVFIAFPDIKYFLTCELSFLRF